MQLVAQTDVKKIVDFIRFLLENRLMKEEDIKIRLKLLIIGTVEESKKISKERVCSAHFLSGMSSDDRG